MVRPLRSVPATPVQGGKGIKGMRKTVSRDLRKNPRLRLSYPIHVTRPGTDGESELGRTVTHNLSARGAYFRTFNGEAYEEGAQVALAITVPHQLSSGKREILLDLRGRGRVVRVEPQNRHGAYGENGGTLSGVAIEFVNPLAFYAHWG